MEFRSVFADVSYAQIWLLKEAQQSLSISEEMTGQWKALQNDQ